MQVDARAEIRDSRPTREPVPSPEAPPPVGLLGALDATAVLALQRSAGNRATTRMLARNPPDLVAERREFEQGQERFFAEVGEEIQEHIRGQAHLQRPPSTAEEALRVTALWGLTIDQIAASLPVLTQSLAQRVEGTRESTSLEAQQQALVAALTPDGRQAYQDVMQRVRAEAFWRRVLDGGQIFVFPDLSGQNRYGGYTQHGTVQGDGSRAHIVHISKDPLEAREVDTSAATLVHELSHTVYEPAIVDRALAPLLGSLSGLIADHPQIQELRRAAPDQAQARAAQVRNIRQMLYERTGYAEAEIFVHLQELTHMPAQATLAGEQMSGSHYILAVVEIYLEHFKRIGIPPRMLRGMLDSLARRTAILYDRRMEAVPANSPERQRLQLNKELALATLSLARGETDTR